VGAGVQNVVHPGLIWSQVILQRGQHHDDIVARNAALIGFPGLTFTSYDMFFIAGCNDSDDLAVITKALLDEPFVVASSVVNSASHTDHVVRIEVALKPGVTDRVALQLEESALRLGFEVRVASGSVYEIAGGEALTDQELSRLVSNLLSNPVIETWALGTVAPGFAPLTESSEPSQVEVIAIRDLNTDELLVVNKERGLALDLAELQAVQTWYISQDRDPTDAELETIAQTWSEHCSHKTFTAHIQTPDGAIEPLFSQLRATTKQINAPFVVSAFDGNAGIVQFGSLPALAIKAETHNHPSAVEPFGGANTGVGGVIRDVLAAPARPIALTDILCFGMPDTEPHDIQDGVLHPLVIREGVVAGIADYGNKMGIPTVAGAVLYDEGFTSNPLVFCGCVGEVLAGYASIGTANPGDRIVVIGGATGRDGIKGATFSSMTMDASTGEVAGASVQIGDPIVERLVGEVLVELLDRAEPLCTALTDCGAGGLSSAVGEMAEGVGAVVDLALVARKYAGLAPWEVWLSEAQERMVLAVQPAQMSEVQAICDAHGVQRTDIGSFTGSHRMVVVNGDEVVVDLPTEFMHKGRPQRQMRAAFRDYSSVPETPRVVDDYAAMLCDLLAHPTIASKEAIVRRFDHEILGATVLGPMSAPHQSGPSDGAVIAAPQRVEGFALGIGVNPQYGKCDPFAMAWSAVDEAIRNVVVTGADPSSVALLDNFSWGDPRREETLGDLVSAVNGCCEASKAFSAPFVSGKDSLNNEYEGSDGLRQSIPPTLVITALAHVPNADVVVTPSLKNPGNAILLFGVTNSELRASHLDLVLGKDHGGAVPAPDAGAPARYRALHQLIQQGIICAAHDVSDGGLAVALAEMVLSSHGKAMTIDLSCVHDNDVVALFAESNGRIIVEVALDHVSQVHDMMKDSVAQLGVVTTGDELVISCAQPVRLMRNQLLQAWAGGI
jgi:phosphoribosylformylglycinamidine synthase